MHDDNKSVIFVLTSTSPTLLLHLHLNQWFWHLFFSQNQLHSTSTLHWFKWGVVGPCEVGALLCQGQISGFSGKQIPTVTPNKSGIVGPRSVSSPALYNYPPCAVKQLSEREDYQLTIIWPRRLSCDNYLSTGLSLKITREIPFRLFWHKILKWASFEMVILLVTISLFSFVKWQSYSEWWSWWWRWWGFHWVQCQLSILCACAVYSWWNITNPIQYTKGIH